MQTTEMPSPASDEDVDTIAASETRKRSSDASAAVKRPREDETWPAGEPAGFFDVLRGQLFLWLTRGFRCCLDIPLSDALCQCPLKCSERVPPRTRHQLFRTFVEMGDEDVQNEFLQKFVEARPVADRLFSTETTANGKLLRRVRCKYKIPLVVFEDFMSSE